MGKTTAQWWTWAGDEEILGDTRISLSWHTPSNGAELKLSWSGDLALGTSARHAPIQVSRSEILVPSFCIRNPAAARALSVMLRLAWEIQDDMEICADNGMPFRPIDFQWKPQVKGDEVKL